MDRPAQADALAPRVDAAITRATEHLLQQQAGDGHWCGELEGDSLLQSEYILLQAFLHGEQAARLPLVAEAAETLLRQQEPHGAWSLFAGDEPDISASVKAYFALKVAGHPVDSSPLVRAREAILDAGGATAVNSFTRFFLALLGQAPYEVCPAVAPEAVLLPGWAPLNIYRVSAWSRTILVPLSVMWACRPVRRLPQAMGIGELLGEGACRWPTLRRPAAGRRRWLSWETMFHGLDRGLKTAERLGLRPLRRAALQRAERWMLDRFADSDGLGAIFPPIVWSRVALKCLGYGPNSAEVAECDRQLQDLIVRDERGTRIQPCKSPVWDTANALRALAAGGASPEQPSVAAAVGWLLQRQIDAEGDWSLRVDAAPGGWAFEYRNAFYPDVDDTIMVMLALRELRADSRGPLQRQVAEACERGRRWVLAMQNRDGGWGAFDKDNDASFLCEAPFADHNAMIDPSTPDLAARVIESLAACSMTADEEPLRRAAKYLLDNQEADGSWYGRWGVNHIYGTWQALVGLAAAGMPRQHAAVQRGRRWLLDHQQPAGGWGESPASYAVAAMRGCGPATPSQTAWALLGLLASGEPADDAVLRGVSCLAEQQQEGGGWDEPQLTGTGFPLVFYLRYHMYPVYFPLQALATWRRRMRPQHGPHRRLAANPYHAELDTLGSS